MQKRVNNPSPLIVLNAYIFIDMTRFVEILNHRQNRITNTQRGDKDIVT